MNELKKCDCGKTISAVLGVCWSCWNAMGRKSEEHYCSCGIDIADSQYGECPHQEPTERSVRMTAEQYKHFEFWCDTEAETDGSWSELELTQAKEHLLKQIDIALENGAKYEFLELTAKLNELMEMA